MNKQEISTYMAGLGKAGGTALKKKMLKENPNYYSELAKIGWEKRRKEKL